MRNAQDMARELSKVLDAVEGAHEHFSAEAKMNAALHMATLIRPAPLAVAIEAARDDLLRIIGELMPAPILEAHELPDDLTALVRQFEQVSGGGGVFMTLQEPWQAKIRYRRDTAEIPWRESEVIAEASSWADLCDRTREAIEARLAPQEVTA